LPLGQQPAEPPTRISSCFFRGLIHQSSVAGGFEVDRPSIEMGRHQHSWPQDRSMV
ncbi:hypothetical protein JOQ06_021784, partial [Pogonophryne albipinna]